MCKVFFGYVFSEQTIILFKTLITSIALPFVISLLKNVTWDRKTKQIFAIGFSALTTFGMLLFDNQLGKVDTILAILITVLATQGNYKVWFSESPFEHVLSNLFSIDQVEAKEESKTEAQENSAVEKSL